MIRESNSFSIKIFHGDHDRIRKEFKFTELDKFKY